MQNAGSTPYPHPGNNTTGAYPGWAGAEPEFVAPVTGWDRVASLSMVGLIGQLWRQLPVMMVIFIAIFATAMFGVMNLKKEYTSSGRILVQFGEEYIYNPIIGTAGQGTAYSTDQMIQAEVGFFTAAILRERVLKKIGLRRLFPKLAAKYEMEPMARSAVMGQAIESMQKNLNAYTAPNQPLISVSYRNENPAVAAQVLNAVIDEYLSYRQEILVDTGNSRFGKERATTEQKLEAKNKELALFLNRNSIGDFLAERTAAGVRFAALNDQLLAANARSREIAAGILARESRLGSVPREILQFTDDASSGELATLEIQREQLLSRYKPGSKPVLAIDANIRRLERFIADGKNKSLGTKRTGINLVHQTLQSEKFSLESEAQSIRERISILKAQIAQVRNKQKKLQRLFPEYQRLAGKVEVLQVAVRQFSTREEEYQARRNLAEEASNNIRVIERPVVPFEGKSMKRPAAILAFLFAGFTALMVGLAIVFSKVSKSSRPQMPPQQHPPAQYPPAPPFAPGPTGGQTSYAQAAPPTTQAAANAQFAPYGAVGANQAYHQQAHQKPAAHYPEQRLNVEPALVRPPPVSQAPPASQAQVARVNPLAVGPGGLAVLANIERKTSPRRQ